MEVETKAGWISAVQQLGKAAGGNGGEVTSDDITDATEVGKGVITAGTQEAARTAIGAGTSDFSGSYADLSDKPSIPAAATVDTLGGAGATGKTVMKAGNAEAARTAIGAGTSNFSGSYADLSDKPTIPAAATVDNLGGAGATGKVVMKAANAEAARTAIGAGTSNLAIGTTASTAKAGNYTPTTNEVSASLKAKAEIVALTEIADPTSATPEDVATAVNAIIAALKA